MAYKDNKLGVFIVPTGVGASIGGFAGDASSYAKKFTDIGNLIVNPNVVNAGCFSGINNKMFYVEGYAIDEFFKGKLNLKESKNNKLGIVFDKSIPQDVLNIHINTMSAVEKVYGIEEIEYVMTEEEVGVEFYIDDSGISTGYVKNIETLLKASKELINLGCEAIGVVCLFNDDNLNEDYENGNGVDPIGGVEAIISHYMTKNLNIPCVHAPAFKEYDISTKVVNPKAAAEYITPTFLPCILLGLINAPKLQKARKKDFDISIDNVDYLVMPYNSLGSIPVFEALKRDIKVYAVRENVTLLNVTDKSINKKCGIKVVNTYKKCLELIEREIL
ncbi:DUF3326 domain-containing protein [bacterium]|nr:DUF3326 domain-containing protein [bacterium]